MIRADVTCRWLLVCVVLCAAVVAGSARADDPPIVTVGNTSDPTGSATASGTANRNGDATACVNNQNSNVDSSQSGQSPVAIANGTCESASGANGGARDASSASGTASTGTSTTSQSSAAAGATSRAATATVAAQGASGIEISRIVSNSTAGRIRLVVTVRDMTRRLIRGAAVGLTPLPGAAPLSASGAKFTNQRGRAIFQLRVPKTYRGARLRFLITARTPSAHTTELVSVRSPR